MGIHAEDIVEMAEYYASLGWVPVPTHGVIFTDNIARCTCTKPTCKKGKHPMYRGYNDITSPEEGLETVIRAASENPDLNLAIALEASRLVVIDIDGDEGQDSWARMLQTAEALLPEGPLQISGSGNGLHFFTRLPLHIELYKDIAEGVELKARGMLTHVYPSRHESGGSYEWVQDEDLGDRSPSANCLPEPLPKWVEALGAKGGLSTTFVQDERQGVRDKDLRKLLKSWDKRRDFRWGQYADGVRALLDIQGGTSKKDLESQEAVWSTFPEGSREDFLKICTGLAQAYPEVKAENVLACLRPALDYRTGRGAGTSYDDVVQMLKGAQKHVQEKKQSNALLDALQNPEDAYLNGQLAWKVDAQGNRSLHLCDSNVQLKLQVGAWQGVLAFNERAQRLVYVKEPPYGGGRVGAFVEESDVTLIIDWFSTQPWGVQGGAWTVSITQTKTALFGLRPAPFDPVVDYLESLQWDGVPRLARCLIDQGGAEDSRYTTEVTSCWFIGAVARALEPGCKMDTVIVLESEEQGVGKSSMLRALCKERAWFADNIAELGTKDAYLDLMPKWIIEMAEMSTVLRSTNQATKTFLSSSEDNYRPPYQRTSQSFPRRSVLAGSTNDEEYLGDVLNRRYWPVRVSKIHVGWFLEHRDQIWAEARFLYGEGRQWHITDPEIEALAEREQAKRRIADVLEDILCKVLDEAVEISDAEAKKGGDKTFAGFEGNKLVVVGGFLRVSDIVAAVGVKSGRGNIGQRITRCMKILGWEPKRLAHARGFSRKMTLETLDDIPTRSSNF